MGEDAASDDWCLVFAHPLQDRVLAVAEPALLRTSGDQRQQPVRLEISRLGPPTTATITTAAGAALQAPIATGYTELRVGLPGVAAPATTEVSVAFADGSPTQILAVAQRPVRQREVWLLAHPHLDIGYTDLQDEVERRHHAHLDQALMLAAQTAEYPPEARFRWNVEQLWAVTSWWRAATGAERDRFARAVHEDAIGLQALLAGVLTGLCHPAELEHLTDAARELSAALDAPIDTAMITDIPGQTWTLVAALARAGVRYLSSGPNYMPGLPDGGDRVGGMLRAWGDRPVWWESPDGLERVLFWTAGRGYSWFHGLNDATLDPERPRALLDYLRDLEAQDYPYDLVQVRYTIGGDNGPPDPALPDHVRAWNERFAWPRLVIATASTMFQELERRHGAALPVVRGDLTPCWEDGAASSARETALNRNSAYRLVQAEALWNHHAPADRPTAEITAAWRTILLFSEHTWGAAESMSQPDSPHVQAQWAYKRDLALNADRLTRDLRDRALAAAGRPAAAGEITVHNTLDHERTEVVNVPPAASRAGDRVVDEAGRPVPSQRLRDGRLALLAAQIPGRDKRSFRVIAGAAAAPGARARASGCVLQNDRLRVVVDPVTGAIASLRWLPLDVELVDRSVWPGLNAYLYVPGRDPAQAVGVQRSRVTVGEAGPLVASLLITSTARGARSLRRVLRLAAGSDRLEINDLIDKLPVRTKESVHLAFPLRVPGGQVHLDLGGVLVRPDLDQLAGACRDWFCVHSGVAVMNDRYGVAWITRDAPLVEVGALTDETPGPGGTRRWRQEVGQSSTLFSYAMNNHWHTNYRADQEGPVTLRYAVQPQLAAAADLVAVGQACTQPLLVSWTLDSRAPAH